MKKLNKKQKITLRTVIAAIRNFFIVVAILTTGIGIVGIDDNFIVTFILVICGIIEFLVVIGLDKLLFETAYSGDKKNSIINFIHIFH